MKISQNILVLMVAISLLFACSKSPIKVLPSKGGNWKTSGVVNTVLKANGSVTQTVNTNFSGTITFKKDKSYESYSDQAKITTKGTWQTIGSDKIILSQYDPTEEEISYDITEATSKSEKWKSVSINTQDVSGISIETISTVTMELKK